MSVRNRVRILLLKIFYELRHGCRIAYLLRDLLRILLPSVCRERLRRWRNQVEFFRSDRKLWLSLQKKLAAYAGRLFYSHRYCQEIYGEDLLLTLLISCDSSGDFFTVLHASLKKQTWLHFEVIFLVCDDDQELKQKLSAMIAQEGHFGWHVLSTDSSSQKVCNRALGAALGKYIAFLHSGDDLELTFLEECLLLLEASPPHFFIQSENRSLALEEEDFGIVDPVASLYRNRFRVVVFPRLVGLALAGYDEIMPTGFKEWEFYVKLIRHGYVGRSLPSRISRGLVCESVSAESNGVGFALGKKRIQALHLGYIVNHERWLRRRARQYWQVTEPLCNLLPSAGVVKKKALWLDLTARPAVPGSLLTRLMVRFEDPDIPLIVTIDSRRQSFFHYNKKAGLQVYPAESYHLQGNRDYLYSYLQASYQLEKVYPEDFLQLPKPGSANSPKTHNRKAKLRILYVAPWLITGGADTMTVDWFCQLNSAWSDKYFVTTLFRDNNWLPKIADYAQGIYDLPALGYLDPAAMTDFLLEFIALQNIDILHIMNSEIAFQALPELKERFPNLKVVAQFHCFDYFADGCCTGYAFTVPPRYDHLIDRYNLEYSRLGEEIVQLYPNIESSKFAVIYGRVDGDFYNPTGRLPSAQIAAYQRKDALNLLFIGRLDRQKQPLRLLKIAVALRDQGVPFVMHVIGDGNLESQKDEFLAELQGQGLADQVRFYGEQPLETLVDWYLIADVLLLTSDWEGVPMVLYQAMAMAVVPVVVDVGGCAELVTPACGYLVSEKENAQAYVCVIRELLDNQRRQEMGAWARRRMIDHFSLAGLDQEYRTFYESLV